MTVLWRDMRLDAEAQTKKLDILRNELQSELIMSMCRKMNLSDLRSSEGFHKLDANIKELTEAVLGGTGGSLTRVTDGIGAAADARRHEQIMAVLNRLDPASESVAGDTISWGERERAVLKRLNTSPYRDRKDRNPDPVRGTCKWFEHHELFRGWRESKSSSMLWVSADPGCGKSVLAKHLVDSILQTPESGTVCYFFFKDDFADQRSVASALSCILYQLFQKRRSLLSGRILDRLDPMGGGGRATNVSFSDLWETLVDVAKSKDAGEIICLLDAIDECEDQGQSELSRALCQLYGRREIAADFNLKFLLTSRPYDSIRIGFRPLDFQDLPVIHLSGESDAEVKKISKEIDAVIQARVCNIRDKRHLTQRQEDILLQQLTRIPNRTYLWVHLTLDLVEKAITADEARIQEVTSRLPKTVDEAYDRILSKTSDPKAAKRLLHIIVAAARPLTLAEMNIALALSPAHRSYNDLKPDLRPKDRFHDDVRGICGLFVTVIDSKIYLLHQTAKEFLVRSSTNPLRDLRSGLTWRYSLRPQDSHRILANICICYLLFTEFEDTPPSQPADAYVFLDYAAKHWAAHVRGLPGKLQDAMSESMLEICDAASNRCLTWLEVYWESTSLHPPQRFNTLMIAAYFGLKTVVKRLLEKSAASLNSQDGTYGRSALSWAAGNGHDAVVSLLTKGAGINLGWLGLPLQSRAEVDSLDTQGRSPLSYAVLSGSIATVRLLMKAGARVDLEDKIGGTPLLYAVCSGRAKVTKLLLSGGETETSAEDGMVRRLLFSAVEKDDGAIVGLLLETGRVNLQVIDDVGRTPLSWAAEKGGKAVVKLLLDKGADPNLPCGGRTPLSWAAETENEAAVKLLLDKGADPNLACGGRTPLFWAAEKGNEAIAKLLLDRGADSDLGDKSYIPLSWPVKWGSNALVQLLLNKGADPNLAYGGRTPLSWAAEKGNEAMVKLLLMKGANVNTQDDDARSALHIATRTRQEAVMSLLLEKGADIEAKDSDKYTALSVAIENSFETGIEMLLAKRCQVNFWFKPVSTYATLWYK